MKCLTTNCKGTVILVETTQYALHPTADLDGKDLIFRSPPYRQIIQGLRCETCHSYWRPHIEAAPHPQPKSAFIVTRRDGSDLTPQPKTGNEVLAERNGDGKPKLNPDRHKVCRTVFPKGCPFADLPDDHTIGDHTPPEERRDGEKPIPMMCGHVIKGRIGSAMCSRDKGHTGKHSRDKKLAAADRHEAFTNKDCTRCGCSERMHKIITDGRCKGYKAPKPATTRRSKPKTGSAPLK